MSDAILVRPDMLSAPDPLRSALERALGAQYDVLALLGRGGMGAVYLARERLLERLVAIKVLPSEHTDPEARERFLREARMAAQLSHPNIVPLLSFGEMGDTLFYIMRYVDGESLESRLQRERTVPADEARRILRDLADALAEAHRLGIVHRDIKPDNVMIERATGRPMLTDFGVARQLAGSATLTGTGIILGSPQYMSPEQASGDRHVDGRSDLYSLGIMGYRMLTGRLPFSGETMRELLLQQITADADRITTYAPDVPLDLADAIMRCLAKDPSGRWTDAPSLRFALADSSVDATTFPDALDGVPRGGTRILQVTYLTDLGLGCLYAYTMDAEWLMVATVLTVIALAFPAVNVYVRTRRGGLSWRRVLPIAFWPAARSVLWWPTALRPPGDVYDRLPAPVRAARIWQSAGIAFLCVALPLFCLGGFIAGWEHHTIMGRFFLSALGTSMAGSISVLVGALSQLRWKKRWPLSEYEVKKLLSEPTHDSRFWERPSIAALLVSPDATGSHAPTTVDGMARAIGALASGLPKTPDGIADDATAAAGDLVAELRALDDRIRELAEQVDPAEQQRLHVRLAALGAERPDEPDVARRMRALLLGQEALFAQLDAQRASLEAQHSALHEQLRTLWLQMVNYDAQVAAQGHEAVELSGRIRLLCESIQRRMSAAEEAEAVLRER